MTKIGYLGLGVMGHGMSRNLIQKSNTPIYGYDVVESACIRFSEEGGICVADPRELYESCDIIFLCLPTNALVESTVKQIMEVAKKGTIIVDMGSTSPYIIWKLNELAIKNGLYLLDSPVSGGEAGSNAGTLAIMSGGAEEVFSLVKPYLMMMGKTVTYMGPSGCGSKTKIANNMMVGIHLAAMGEAFAFAKKSGIDPHTLFKAIRGGAAQSAVMDAKVLKMLSRDFTASARIAVHLKDINNAMEMAGQLGVELPLTEIVKTQMDYMQENGMVNEDQCALVKYYEKTMGVEVK